MKILENEDMVEKMDFFEFFSGRRSCEFNRNGAKKRRWL